MLLIAVRRLAVLAGAGVVASLAAAALADADPEVDTVGGSASDVVDDLRAQGYNVEINWTNGFNTKPLSECWVTGTNNPGDETPSKTTFVTVYIDVMCPNHDN
ncbi:MAG: hypothetical protein NVS4B6_23790 [Mycobacterium sp.]